MAESDSSSTGRGRPPLHTRFRPGVSGNPTGRPKGGGFKTELIVALSELVEIGDGRHRTRVTTQRAIITALLRKAIRGDLRAVETVMRACVPAASQSGTEEEADAPEDRAIVQALVESTATSNRTPEEQ